jgi:hypothetical protein
MLGGQGHLNGLQPWRDTQLQNECSSVTADSTVSESLWAFASTGKVKLQFFRFISQECGGTDFKAQRGDIVINNSVVLL